MSMYNKKCITLLEEKVWDTIQVFIQDNKSIINDEEFEELLYGLDEAIVKKCFKCNFDNSSCKDSDFDNYSID